MSELRKPVTVRPRAPRERLNWVAIQIEDSIDGETWRRAQGWPTSLGANVKVRFHIDANLWRAVWVAEGGVTSDYTPPKRIA